MNRTVARVSFLDTQMRSKSQLNFIPAASYDLSTSACCSPGPSSSSSVRSSHRWLHIPLTLIKVPTQTWRPRWLKNVFDDISSISHLQLSKFMVQQQQWESRLLPSSICWILLMERGKKRERSCSTYGAEMHIDQSWGALTAHVCLTARLHKRRREPSVCSVSRRKGRRQVTKKEIDENREAAKNWKD